MFDIGYDLICLITGRENRTPGSGRWGLAIPAAAAAVTFGLYIMCRLRLLQNVFLQRACAVALAGIVGTALFTPVSMAVAHRLGAVDLPGGRRIHERATPRLGGLGIMWGLIFAWMVNSDFTRAGAL